MTIRISCGRREGVLVAGNHRRRRRTRYCRRVVGGSLHLNGECRQGRGCVAVAHADQDVGKGALVGGGGRSRERTRGGAESSPSGSIDNRKAQRRAPGIGDHGLEAVGLTGSHGRGRCARDRWRSNGRWGSWRVHRDTERTDDGASRAIRHTDLNFRARADVAVARSSEELAGRWNKCGPSRLAGYVEGERTPFRIGNQRDILILGAGLHRSGRRAVDDESGCVAPAATSECDCDYGIPGEVTDPEISDREYVAHAHARPTLLTANCGLQSAISESVETTPEN